MSYRDRDTFLEIDDVICSYGYTPVFSEISASLRAGEIVALIGPNGAGKTTLLKCIAGLIKPGKGQILWAGEDASPMIRRFLCHWISTDFPLKRKLTVAQNLQFLMALKTGGMHDNETIKRALRVLNIDLMMHKRVETLSSGQRTRVFLASLLLDERPIWLLDEPSTSLDSSARLILCGMIKRHVKKQGGLAIIATHDPELFAADSTLEIRKL